MITFVYLTIIAIAIIIRLKNKATKNKQLKHKIAEEIIYKSEKRNDKKHLRSERAYIDMAKIWAKIRQSNLRVVN